MRRFIFLSLLAAALGCIAIVYYLRLHSMDHTLRGMAKRYNIQNYYIDGMTLHDNLEKQAYFNKIFPEVNERATKKADELSIHGIGRSAFIENEMKRIFKTDYGLNWRTIKEMNPWGFYD